MARGSLPHQRVCSQWWVILGRRRAVALRTEPTITLLRRRVLLTAIPLRAYGPKPSAYERRRRPRPGAAAVCSCAGAVAQVHHAVAEPALIQQFELKPDPVGEEGLAAAHHDGPDEQLVLVHQPGGDRLGAQVRTAHDEITLGCRLQSPDRFGVEVPLDPRPGGGGRLQRRSSVVSY